ncbi:bifunctional DNA primase/polymerase [Streptomyces sp. SBC-4]|nr:bifunctional DNA primase/polymerase [Streptomyces sp. SBC-4]MDV5143147.1 bifunctional DNA primase/polymerase [Streptomyces sp. SBC-4]
MPGTTGLATALWCAEQGWRFTPCSRDARPRRPTAPPAAPRDTHPPTAPCLAAHRWCHGFHAATLDTDRITHWWRDNPRHGVGVACGPAGLVVVDIDTTPRPRPRATASGRESRSATPSTSQASPTASTPSPSSPPCAATTARTRHHHPARTHTLRRTARLVPGRRHTPLALLRRQQPRTALAWQVDIRAHGGYIVAPTTTLPTGSYQPLDGPRTPAPLPGWLAAELQRTGHHRPLIPHPRTPAAPPHAPSSRTAAGAGHQQDHPDHDHRP